VNVADLKGVRKAVLTVPGEAGLAQVAALMRQANVGALVVSHDGREVAGIVTERDIVQAVGRQGSTNAACSAAQLMSTPVLTCAPDDRVSQVMETMLTRRVRHLPLVDYGHLIGMVSMGDVVKSVLAQVQAEADVLRDMYLQASYR
jgi:CBS domain-containing protein